MRSPRGKTRAAAGVVLALLVTGALVFGFAAWIQSASPKTVSKFIPSTGKGRSASGQQPHRTQLRTRTDSVTKAQYQAEVLSIVRDSAPAFRLYDQIVARHLQQARCADQVNAFEQDANRLVNRAAALTPPANVKPIQDRFVTAARQSITTVGQVSRDVAAGRVACVPGTQPDLRPRVVGPRLPCPNRSRAPGLLRVRGVERRTCPPRLPHHSVGGRERHRKPFRAIWGPARFESLPLRSSDQLRPVQSALSIELNARAAVKPDRKHRWRQLKYPNLGRISPPWLAIFGPGGGCSQLPLPTESRGGP